MSFHLRIVRSFLDEVLSDLRRRHEFAFERVGFLLCRTGTTRHGTLILPFDYHPVFDDEYLDDQSVGARIGSSAIRRAMQVALEEDVTLLHVHLHDHKGQPSMSRIDKAESQKLIPSFFNVRPNLPHGALILSNDSAGLWVWPSKGERSVFADEVSIIGNPITFTKSEALAKPNPVLVRQSFLGRDAEGVFQTVRVAIVGLGGGGSHIAHQLVHLGVSDFMLFDPDEVALSNLNRLIGATLEDVKDKRKKVAIAERYIKSVNPNAVVETFDKPWQETGNAIREADVLFGGVDTYLARQELEATARRYFIPYLDIGMDVNEVKGRYFMSGQVIVSLPGRRCMKCMGFLTDEKLGMEAAQYGAAGDHPQVIWANGVLASNVVGRFVQLSTGWTSPDDFCEYDAYDGNTGRIFPHPRLEYSDTHCEHYPLSSAGDPLFI